MPLAIRAGRRKIASLLALVAFVGLAVPALFSPRASADPANPSDAQLAAAAAVKAQAAKDVGRLSGLIAAADAEIQHLDGLAELAKEQYLKALSDLAAAKDAATQAHDDVVTAQAAVDQATAKYRKFIVAAYYNRDDDSSSVFVANDPNSLLRRGDFLRYTSAHQLNALGDLNRATVAKSNADAAARTAVTAQAAATDNANSAQRVAVSAVQNAKVQEVALQGQKAQYQQQLDTAGMALTGLQDQRAAYVAWQAEQARKAAEEAARQAAERAAMIAAQQRNAAAAAAAAKTSGSGNSGNSGSSSGTGSGTGYSTAVSSGSWTAAKGQAAVARASQYLGTKYSWAAGNANGPTYGLCVTQDAGWNDCHVFGFDCSGLALFAWAPYVGVMAHYAATQYGYGRVHPSLNQLMPGDLLFWSSNGTVAGIHHVAIYVGNGQVIQAPQSGDVVKISYIWSSEYFGATRPGS